MSGAVHSHEPNPATVHGEAVAAAVRHTGPAAERYHQALVRYLDTVSHPAERPEHRHSLSVPAALVADVMTHGVVAAHEDAPFKEIVAALARNRVSAVPVIDSQRRVVGMVSESDLITRIARGSCVAPRGHRHELRAAAKSKARAGTARELMTAPAITIRAHTMIVDAARMAAHARVRHLPVVDQDGLLIGIVTRTDLLRVFLRDDNEIKREIEYFVRHKMLLNPLAIEVDVTEGVVKLTGQVERWLLVEQLLHYVRAISGVVEIVNHLTARFDDRYIPAPPAVYHVPRPS
ncbi:MAG TPA: CBS domain-containing protein [Mycobacterium sp.]|jgi:CBS domain-containing protein|nr:CBS domain-containing protein [Mycobacterium sp.]